MQGLEVLNINNENNENVKYLEHFIKQFNSYSMLNIYPSFDTSIPNSDIYLSDTFTKKMYQYKMDISTTIYYIHIFIKNRKHLKCSSACSRLRLLSNFPIVQT